MFAKIIPVLLVMLMNTLFCLHGQENKNTKPPATTSKPNINPQELELLLKSLTKDEVQVEVEAWMELLQEKVHAVSMAEIDAMKATGEQKDAILEKVNLLREERTAAIDRLKVVLKSLFSKGGEIDVYDKYIKAVSGLTLDEDDSFTAVKVIQGWLMSKEGGIRWGTNIAKFLLILIMFRFLARLAAGILRNVLERASLDVSDLLKEFSINIIRKVVFLLGLIIAISMLEINIGPLLAGVGVAGFVIGFALQDTLSNFAAGFMILLYRPYDIGNFITANNILGTVDSMNLVSTTIKTPDNKMVIVPNSKIWGDVITNATGSEMRRVDMMFGISYQDDINKAQAILEDIVKQHKLTLDVPEPVIKVHELADSSVNFVCRPWSKTEDYWTVYWDVTRAVKDRFDAEGISIPFPQRDVHVYNSTDK